MGKKEHFLIWSKQFLYVWHSVFLHLHNSNQSLGYLDYENGEANDDWFIWESYSTVNNDPTFKHLYFLESKPQIIFTGESKCIHVCKKKLK